MTKRRRRCNSPAQGTITPQQKVVGSPIHHPCHHPPPRTTRITRKEIYENNMHSTQQHHPNMRLVKTAPRPSRTHHHGLLRGIDESSSSSFDSGDPELLIRKNLFAPPVVVQNEIFRTESKAMNHYQTHILTSSQRNHHRQHSAPSASASAAFINDKQNRPESSSSSLSSQRGAMVKRTGNDQYCGLSAEIAHAIAYRTPSKAQTTPLKTPNKSFIGRGLLKTPGMVGILKTPARYQQLQESSDTLSLTMTPVGKENDVVNLSQTVTMSSSSDDDIDNIISPPSRLFMPGQAQIINAAVAKQNETKAVATKTAVLQTPRTQPIKKKRAIRKTPFPCSSSRKRVKKSLTPPRKNYSSHMKLHRSSSATNSTAFEGVNDYVLTSSECDPSPFQVELPTKKEIVVHSKICELMDGYTAIHRDFNFAMLCGVSRTTLVKEYDMSTHEKPMIAGSCHRDVVRTLLACAEDIVVEGFFREYTQEEKDRESERLEACILSSDSLRQIIVCFRGSTTNQAKPLKCASTNLFGKQESTCLLHEEHKVQVLDTFRHSYFGTPLEKAVFALLGNLTTRKPFFDVVMTGHSFGAAMATIASFRYASSKPQMRVSCHVFSSPRIGGEAWRQLVHSVPNLRIYRTENGSDPYISLPSGNEWVHCGHAIQIHDLSACGKNVRMEAEIEIKVRRFDRDATASSNSSNLLGYVQSMVIPKNMITNGVSSTQQGKLDHEIQSYVELLARSGEKWFTDFCDCKGKGVSGANDEVRRLA